MWTSGGGPGRVVQAGLDAGGVGRALELVAARGASAQLTVLHRGRVVVDRSWGASGDVPFLLFSAGKPLMAVLVHRLAARGVLGLDEAVARYWPEFAASGKGRITVRHVLQHRSGVPFGRGLVRDALAAPSWERSVRALAAARPAYEPGAVAAYHVLSYGFLLGEVVRRVTGEPLREVLRREVLDPLGMRDTHLGTPRGQWRQRVPLRGAAGAQQFWFNRRGPREGVIPAASVSATARDLARFYQGMLDGVVLDDLAPAVAPSSDGEADVVLGGAVRWSAGFQLGGVDDPGRPSPLGLLSSRRAFGHNGSNACLGWADPERELVVAYVTNLLSPGQGPSAHLRELSDTLIDAADAATRSGAGG